MVDDTDGEMHPQTQNSIKLILQKYLEILHECKRTLGRLATIGSEKARSRFRKHGNDTIIAYAGNFAIGEVLGEEPSMGTTILELIELCDRALKKLEEQVPQAVNVA